MVICSMIQYKEGEFKEFIIKPNNSLSWNGNKIFFFILFFISFVIAFSFAMAGMWLILPFAGLEMILLGSALTFCYIKNSQCEIVKIDENNVSVSLIKSRNKKVFGCSKYWAKFILNKPHLRGYPHKLVLRSAGREMEIGALLTDEERIKLAGMLKKNVEQ